MSLSLSLSLSLPLSPISPEAGHRGEQHLEGGDVSLDGQRVGALQLDPQRPQQLLVQPLHAVTAGQARTV